MGLGPKLFPGLNPGVVGLNPGLVGAKPPLSSIPEAVIGPLGNGVVNAIPLSVGFGLPAGG